MRPHRIPLLGLLFLSLAFGGPLGAELAPTHPGAVIYQQLCVSCHGTRGEGVADKCDEPLYGDHSIEALARLITRTMPEDDPKLCVGDDAQAVAAYIHKAFYSPDARARNQPPRVELTRLTHRQYQESIADLFGSFGPQLQATNSGGLQAEYYQSKGMNKKDARIFDRLDAAIDFDFGTTSPGDGITADQFSIAWSGSLLAPDSGTYEFRLTTPNGARVYLNTDLRSGDSNRRDDSDARRQEATMDLWVSSGDGPRVATARIPLLGGRSYPLRVDYFKFKDSHASVRFEWLPPGGHWSVIPASHLSPEHSSSLMVLGTSFPPDDASLGYERGSSVSKQWQEATTRAALESANLALTRLSSLTGVRDNETNRLERLREFATRFVERAFRQPLTPELLDTYVHRPFAGDPPPEIALKKVIVLALSSPRFLYPGLVEANSDHAVASRLALVLWDSLPDAPLIAAAAAGQLSDPSVVRHHADRMLQDPRARTKLRDFFHHWLGLEEAEDLSKDPQAFPDFDPLLLADLEASLEAFIHDVVWGDASDFRRLLLDDTLHVNPRLARFYGLEPPEGDDFQPVTFEPERRAGVLTHPYLLSIYAYYRSSSPIHRGVFLARRVLGRSLKPPPMAIQFMDERFDPSLTMREKVTELTRSDTCMGCHSIINPLGFSLEHYDAVGRFRTEDNHKPVDATSDYPTAEGQVIRLTGARDLAVHAAQSDEARQGFVRQLFLHAVKQAPAAFGNDTLQRLDTAFVDSEYHIRQLLAEIAVAAAARPNPNLALQPSPP